MCSETHPEHGNVTCDKGTPCFGFHANAREGLTWPGNPLPVRKESGKKDSSRKAQLAMIAQRAN